VGKRLVVYALVAIGLIASLIISVSAVKAGVPTGYTSQVSIGGSGTGYSTIGLANDTSLNYISSAPIVTTITVSGAKTVGQTAAATLQGNLVSLNGFPSAQVYFQSGTDLTYGTSSAPVTLTSPGPFSTTITIATGTDIHYRAVGATDGTYYGADAVVNVAYLQPYTGVTIFFNVIPLILYIVIFFTGLFGLFYTYRKVRSGDEVTIANWAVGLFGMVLISVNLLFFSSILGILDTIIKGG
jgi:hypothetical protein